MEEKIITEGKFKYVEIGEGTPIIILHGLMGGLSNFHGVTDYFPEKGFKVLIPELPIYDMPMMKTNVKQFAKFLKKYTLVLSRISKIVIPTSLRLNYDTSHSKSST